MITSSQTIKIFRMTAKRARQSVDPLAGDLKGVGRVYQQTFIDTYAKVAFAKLYDRKTPITRSPERKRSASQ